MAIEINGVKHACASCIRGHRVKKCNHVEREMVPIPKRGRQISQCNHCRNLRTTNRTHVKCTCALSTAPNPINGCLCEIIHTCSCVANHLQDTTKPNNDSASPVTPPDTISTTSSSNSPVLLYDFFDLTPSPAVTASVPAPPISSSSPSLSPSSSHYSNNSTTITSENNMNDIMTTMMMIPQETPVMSLSVSELLNLPLQFTVNNDIDLTSALQMQNSF
ncbi:hypothetical protein K501DRAFT_329039 [Backusella circina FSU 941]|nr:hypothetical protein K501DRAFT_329039 [Backusella circina FSU 941]